MKILRLLGLVLLCVTFTGCVKYRVTLTDGTHFTVLGKPKLDEDLSVYRYKSGGTERTVPAGKVSSIEPSSEADNWKGASSGSNSGDTFYIKK
jgi:hypothetical protein